MSRAVRFSGQRSNIGRLVHQKSRFGAQVTKNHVLGPWSPKIMFWGPDHQKSCLGAQITRNHVLGPDHQNHVWNILEPSGAMKYMKYIKKTDHPHPPPFLGPPKIDDKLRLLFWAPSSPTQTEDDSSAGLPVNCIQAHRMPSTRCLSRKSQFKAGC